MKKKVAIYWDNSKTQNIDCRNIEEGNPGLGGSDYSHILLSYLLTKKHHEIFDVFYFARYVDKMPELLNTIEAKNIFEVVNICKSKKIDLLIMDQNKISLEGYDYIESNKIPTILWAHCFLDTYHLYKKIKKNSYIKKIVCVGKEQMEQFIDDELINKTTYIYNFFDNERYNKNITSEKKQNIVTYIGSIVPYKGFHILAKAWKKVLKEVPDAKLYVIGSGQLYDQNAKLGEYNIAESSYEESFIEYLLGPDNEIIDSVKFLGKLGTEKNEILKLTKVGIPNPSGIGETFGNTALEFQGSGIPVITKKCYGYLDTVNDQETGILIDNEEELVEYLIKLLKEKDTYEYLSGNTVKFVKNKFDFNDTLEKWVKLLKNIDKKNTLNSCNLNYNFKFKFKLYGLVNIYFKNKFGIGFPSYIQMKLRFHQIKKILKI